MKRKMSPARQARMMQVQMDRQAAQSNDGAMGALVFAGLLFLGAFLWQLGSTLFSF